MKTQQAQKVRAKDVKVHNRHNIFICYVFSVCVSLCKRLSTLNRSIELHCDTVWNGMKIMQKQCERDHDSSFLGSYCSSTSSHTELKWFKFSRLTSLYKTILCFINTILSDRIPPLLSVSHGDSAAVATGQVLSQSYTGCLICLLHWGNKGRAQEDGEINVLSLLRVHYSALFNPSPPQFPSASFLLHQHSRAVLNHSEQSCAQLLLTSPFSQILPPLPSFSSDTFCLSSCLPVCSQSKYQ